MATNGVQILYNPEFVKKMTPDQICGVLIHECWHVMKNHMRRQGHRIHKKWNVATDYEINGTMQIAKEALSGGGRNIKARLYSLPDGCILDRSISDGLSSEEIYNKLPDGKGGGKGGGSKPGSGWEDAFGPGDVMPIPDGVDPAEVEERVKQWIADGHAVAKMKGSVPAGVDGFVDEVLDPKIPWHEHLRQLVVDKLKDDYSWKRPNRRYAGSGFYLPSLESECIGPVIIGNDTSGSMWDKETLATGLGVCQSILDTMRPKKMVVVDIDCSIHNWREFYPGDTIPTEIKGGGGSSTIPLFKRVEEDEDDKPSCMVIWTDLYIDFPKTEPDYPVIWVTNSKGMKAPFGETIYVGD